MTGNASADENQLQEPGNPLDAKPSDSITGITQQQDVGLATGSNPVEPEPEQEGGLRAWLAIVGSFLVYFATFGVVNSFGVFQAIYQLDYLKDYSPSTISFIGTLQIALMYLSGAVAGALFDTYGLKVRNPLFPPTRALIRARN